MVVKGAGVAVAHLEEEEEGRRASLKRMRHSARGRVLRAAPVQE